MSVPKIGDKVTLRKLGFPDSTEANKRFLSWTGTLISKAYLANPDGSWQCRIDFGAGFHPSFYRAFLLLEEEKIGKTNCPFKAGDVVKVIGPPHTNFLHQEGTIDRVYAWRSDRPGENDELSGELSFPSAPGKTYYHSWQLEHVCEPQKGDWVEVLGPTTRRELIGQKAQVAQTLVKDKNSLYKGYLFFPHLKGTQTVFRAAWELIPTSPPEIPAAIDRFPKRKIKLFRSP